ncbi:MAG: Gfo/Idh/MocA family oxidoreductase [Bacteroidetes bacterium]|nr:Gfo/Idh/MocA family oxidoreductase [Bacteroidota bacterium]
MKNILIVGTGNLGCRHLQALAKLNNNVKIFVLDPQPAALDRAKNSWAEVASNAAQVTYHQDFDFGTEIELAVIATNSNIRSAVTKKMLDKIVVKHIVFEKFLFPELSQYTEIADLLKGKQIKAWVNCPRRMYGVYNEIKKRLKAPVSFSVTGGAWGLACNSIHFLDLFAMLSGAVPAANRAILSDGLLASKREGYIEFSGSVFGNTNNGDTFHINDTNQPGQPITICIADAEKTIHVNEGERYYIVLDAGIRDRTVEPVFFDIPYQSQLTNIFADSILETGTCALTEYGESCRLHTQLLDIFLNQYNKIIQKPDNRLCPIT